ncbi:MAG: thioredoxin family protein [Planctomycetaceae bacterium]
MKHLSLLTLALALFAVGCAEPAGAPVAETESAPAEETHASHDHDGLVPEVDKAGLTEIMDKNSVTFVDFTATWCGPCQKLKPTLHEMAKEFEGKVQFVEVDVDKSKDLATEFEIEAMPTLIVMKDGKEASRVVGADVSAIRQSIESAL